MDAKELRKELHDFNLEFGMLEKAYCTKDEKKAYLLRKKNKLPLPDGVFYDEEQDSYYTVISTEVKQEEVNQFIKYQTLYYLKSIKSMLKFFTVLIVIGLIAIFFLALFLPNL